MSKPPLPAEYARLAADGIRPRVLLSRDVAGGAYLELAPPPDPDSPGSTAVRGPFFVEQPLPQALVEAAAVAILPALQLAPFLGALPGGMPYLLRRVADCLESAGATYSGLRPVRIDRVGADLDLILERAPRPRDGSPAYIRVVPDRFGEGLFDEDLERMDEDISLASEEVDVVRRPAAPIESEPTDATP